MADDRWKNRDEKKTEDNEAESSPLQRYLAKQKAHEPIVADAAGTAGRDELNSVPKAPPPPPPPPLRSEDKPSKSVGHPAGLFARFLASFLDNVIVYAIALPVRGLMGFILWFVPFGIGDTTVGSISIGSFLAVQIVMFFYYGWFYRERGSTPGKMVFGIEVVRIPGGGRLDYSVSYLRESIGKYISGLILLIGYFVAFFRPDRRALHDLIFGTEVIEKIKSS